MVEDENLLLITLQSTADNSTFRGNGKEVRVIEDKII